MLSNCSEFDRRDAYWESEPLKSKKLYCMEMIILVLLSGLAEKLLC